MKPDRPSPSEAWQALWDEIVRALRLVQIVEWLNRRKFVQWVGRIRFPWECR